MIIRKETPANYEQVYRLVKETFSTSPHSEGDEQDYLNELRNSESFLPELSLVTESDSGQIIGQVVLTRMQVSTSQGAYPALLLSPISVLPAFFRRGVARRMLKTAIVEADRMGYSAIFLCGDPAIYSRLGFRPSFEFGIRHIKDYTGNATWCMALEIQPGSLQEVNGTVDIV